MISIETGFTGNTYPLTHPRIAAHPVAGTVTASTEAAGFAGDNANNQLTYTAWKPTAVPANWQLTFTSGPISYCGIAAHDIGSTGGTVYLQEWDGAAWATFKTHVPTDDSPILFLFETRTTDRMRIRIANAIPTIGVIRFGDVLEFPLKCQFVDSLPFNEAIQSVYSQNVSDGGHVMETFATRKAGVCEMTVLNISETWAAANLPALQDYMGGAPVFMADRPETFPKSVVYGMQQQPFVPTRTRPVLNAARSVTFTILANEPA